MKSLRWPAGGWRALAVVLGAVFIYAAVGKLSSPEDLADGIVAYQLLPVSVVNIVTITLPPFELLLGAWLIAGWRQRSASFCATVTLLVFLGALTSARLRGLHIDCACFGASDPTAHSFPLEIARDTALIIAAALLYIHAHRAPNPK